MSRHKNSFFLSKTIGFVIGTVFIAAAFASVHELAKNDNEPRTSVSPGFTPTSTNTATSTPSLTATPSPTVTNTPTPAITPTASPTIPPSPFGSPTGTPLPPCGPMEVLWDQMGSAGTGGTASQDFETSLDAFDATAQDDFMVGSGSAWTIRRVVVRGQYFNGSGPADSFNVGFGDGPPLHGMTYTRNGDVFTIQLPQAFRSLTHVFNLSVQANMDFAAGGQWAWTDRTQTQFLFPANWSNPGGGYMVPQCTNFARRGEICNIDPSFPEQAFRIEGNQGFCAPTPAVSGVVTYGNAIGSATPAYVSNVTITAVGSPTVTATSNAPGPTAGQYSLTGFGAGSYTVTPTKTGGANGITSFDAGIIAQYAAGTSTLNPIQLIVADVSNNGTVSSFDAAQIARYVASTPPYGITGTWKFTPVNKTYSSVTGDLIGEDYTALLMGEVSGNWTNTGARSTTGFDPRALSWLGLY